MRRTQKAKIAALFCFYTAAAHAGTFRDIQQYCFSESVAGFGLHWLEQCLQTVFTDDPYHLTVTAVAPGTGTAFGGAFELIPRFGHYEFLVTGLVAVSTDGSTLGQAQMTMALPSRGLAFENLRAGQTAPNGKREPPKFRVRTTGVRASFTLGARRINAREQDFYGIGPYTSLSEHATYGLQLTQVYAGFNNPLSSWSSIGFNSSLIAPRVTSSVNSGVIPIAQAYNSQTAPGLMTRDNFVHYEPYVTVRLPRSTSFHTNIRAAYEIYQDVGDPHYSFERISATSTTTIPLWLGSRNTPTHRPEMLNMLCPSLRSANRCSVGTVVVTASVVASYSGATHVVPFYFDPTLGGANFQDIDTMRGFRDYRFRGPSSELFQAEYQHPIWGPIGVLSFYDVGNVALRPGDLSLAGMRHDIGAGIYLHAANRELVRFYIAWGSGEGSRSSPKFPAAYQ